MPVALTYRFETVVPPISIALAVVSLVCMLAALALIVVGRLRWALLVTVMTASITAINTYQVAIPNLDTLFTAPRVVTALNANQQCPETHVVSFSYREPSLVFLYERGEIFYPDTLDEAAQNVGADPECTLLLADAQDSEFLSVATQAGGVMEPLAEVAGFNHNEGDVVNLTIYRLRPSRAFNTED